MKELRGSRFLLSAVAVGLSSSVPIAAFGQIEEVMVTAQRRSENLQEVPIAISAFDAEIVAAARVEGFGDLVNRVPSLSVNTYSKGSSFPALRGASVSQPSISGGQSVGLVVDDVPYTTSADWDLSLYDIERVEVLRGPQGTLFGRNVVGGIINVVTKRPADVLGGNLELTAGNYDRFDARGSLNVPMGDAWKTQLSFFRQEHSGTSYNRTTGNDVDATDKYGFRGLVAFERDALDLLITAEYLRDTSGGIARDYIGPASANDPTYVPDNDPRVVTQQYDGDYDMESWFTSARLTYQTSFADFVSVTAYRERDQFLASDLLGLPITPMYVDSEVGIQQFTQEFRLVSNDSGRLKWTVGAFYMDLDLYEDANDYYAFQPNTFLGDMQRCRRLGSASSPVCGDIFGLPPGDPSIPPDPTFVDDATYKSVIDNQTKSYAAYAQLTYALTDKLNLTGGMRYTYEKISGVASESGDGSFKIDQPYEVAFDKSFDAFTPKVSVDYQFTSDHMAYITVAKGFKSGSYIHRGSAETTGIPVDPEIAWNYEVGVKSQWWNRLRLNAAAYRVDYTDQQVFLLGEDGRVVVDNAGEVNVQGVEIELDAAPTDNFALWLTYAYSEGEIKKFPDYEGNDPAQLPPHAATFGGAYTIPAPGLGGAVTLRAEVLYKSDYFLEVSNAPQFETSFDNLLDASINYLSQSGRLGLSLWGKNLTDENVIVYGQDLAGFFYLTGSEPGAALANSPRYNQPRMYGLSLKLSF